VPYNVDMINKSNKVKVTTYLGRTQFGNLKILATQMEVSYATLIRMAVGKYLKNKISG
jgi:hypothetical protein